MNFEYHAESVIRNLTRSLAHDLPAVEAGRGIEPVHRLRVNCRRLHNAFAVFEKILPQHLLTCDSEIKKVLKKLGRARDLDVQIEYFKGLCQQTTSLKTRKALQEYLSSLTQSRKNVQPLLIKSLKRFRTQSIFRMPNQDWLPEGTRGKKLSSQDICKKVQKLRKEVMCFKRFVNDATRIKEFHQMRIAAKHLRYTLEGLAPLYDKKLDSMIGEILHLHNLLGDLHDYHFWRMELNEYSTRERKTDALAPVSGLLNESYQQTFQQFVLAWKATVRKGLWTKLQKFSFGI